MPLDIKAETERIEKLKKEEELDDAIHSFSAKRRSSIRSEDVIGDVNPFVRAILAKFNATNGSSGNS